MKIVNEMKIWRQKMRLECCTVGIWRFLKVDFVRNGSNVEEFYKEIIKKILKSLQIYLRLFAKSDLQEHEVGEEQGIPYKSCETSFVNSLFDK